MIEKADRNMNDQDYIESSGDGVLAEDLDYIASGDLPYERMRNTTIFVTGATGLVGSILIRALAHINRVHRLEMTIVPFLRSLEKAGNMFGDLLYRPDIKVMCGDVTDEIKWEGKVDFIIHCASVTSSKTFVSRPVETIETSIKGTESILKFAREKQIKSMVYISSMEAFGITDPGLKRVREEDLGYIDVTNVRSCYSEGKRMCELLCTSYAYEYGVPVKSARLAQTFGAGVPGDEGRVFAQFIRSAMSGEDIVLHTKGESFGNYCYTADAISGILTILLTGEHSNVYTVVNPETTTRIKDMAAMVAEKFSDGRSKVVFDIPVDAGIYGYAPDVTMHLCADKLMTLGWQPRYGLYDMYKRMKDSWESGDKI